MDAVVKEGFMNKTHPTEGLFAVSVSCILRSKCKSSLLLCLRNACWRYRYVYVLLVASRVKCISSKLVTCAVSTYATRLNRFSLHLLFVHDRFGTRGISCSPPTDSSSTTRATQRSPKTTWVPCSWETVKTWWLLFRWESGTMSSSWPSREGQRSKSTG